MVVARAREKRGAEAAHQGEGCGEAELRKHAALRREASGGVIDDGKAEEKDEDGAARARAEDDAVRRCRRGMARARLGKGTRRWGRIPAWWRNGQTRRWQRGRGTSPKSAWNASGTMRVEGWEGEEVCMEQHDMI